MIGTVVVVTIALVDAENEVMVLDPLMRVDTGIEVTELIVVVIVVKSELSPDGPALSASADESPEALF